MQAVAYFRVSTAEQEQSGLGLDAQRRRVLDFARTKGLEIPEDHQYTETASGGNNDRPELQRALDHARKLDAPLLVAKQDRLSRDLSYATRLLETENIIDVSSPDSSRVIQNLTAVMSDWERWIIRERTRAALAELKAQGVKLGRESGRAWGTIDKESGEFTERPDFQKLGPEKQRQLALERTRQEAELIRIWRKAGEIELDDNSIISASWRNIAELLNQLGYRTKQGNEYQARTAQRVHDRAEANRQK